MSRKITKLRKAQGRNKTVKDLRDEIVKLRRSLEYINNEGELMNKRLNEIDRLFHKIKVLIFKDDLSKIALFYVEDFLKQTYDNIKKELEEKKDE